MARWAAALERLGVGPGDRVALMMRGVAVGRAVRTAIVAVNVVDFFLSLAIWGATTTVRIAG